VCRAGVRAHAELTAAALRWIWCEDPDNHIYHHEYFTLEHKTHAEPHTLTFTIPVREPLPPQYYIRAISDRWLGSESEARASGRAACRKA
jgi:hypothetical protein